LLHACRQLVAVLPPSQALGRLSLLAQLTVDERFRGAGRDLSAPVSGTVLWGVALVGLLAVIGGVVGILISRARAAKLSDWTAFNAQAKEAGLSEEERSLLAVIAKHAGVLGGGRSGVAIFSSEEAFNRGLAAMEASRRANSPGGPLEGNVCSGCFYLFSLREKLGFVSAPGRSSRSAIDLGPISEGAVLQVVRQRSPENFQVIVAASSEAPAELTVRPETRIDCRRGEAWLVRYPRGGTLWEFNAWVVKHGRGQVVLRPAGGVRWINRRRFARVPTNKPAHVANFPFNRDRRHPRAQMGQEGGEAPAAEMLPEFVAGTVVEVGGPGMLVRAPLEAAVGERVLVVVRLRDEKVVEGPAIVRRAQLNKNGMWVLAMELVGLNTAQVDDLTRETNLVAQARMRRVEPTGDEEDASGPGAPRAEARVRPEAVPVGSGGVRAR